MWTRTLARHLLAIAATALLGGFLSATMVRLAPGFDVDERQLDSRLSAASVDAIRAQRAADRNITQFYVSYLKNALRGDLGESRTLQRPVRELLRERLPVTFRLAGLGLALGWALALCLAMLASASRIAALDVLATMLGGAFLSIPAAVLALLFVFADAPAYCAIALIVFPKVFSYTRNLLVESYQMPHIITARAKGIGWARVLVWHVLPVAGTQLLALAGVSVSLALGATIPVEALCGVPGIGQLAWQAALGRDLPLLVTLTALVTVVTLAANSASDIAGQAMRTQTA
jgi:peptide/nickel transport system permease protein